MALTPVTMTGASKDNIKEGFTKVNDIIDDLAAVTSGLGASCIGILDTAGNFTAANVETALAEVYTDHASALTMSALFDENSATTTGLTWGYKGGTFRNDNAITTVAAGTVSLTDDTTNYIEIASNGTVYVVASSFTATRIPIRTVVTASGVQTVSTDKRAWFSTWPTAGSYPDLVDKLKVSVNATTNILDLFESTTGVVPTATYPIKVAIPNGTGITWRTRSTAFVSGTAKFTLTDATGYWGFPTLNGSAYEVYIYAIWSTADSGLVWGLSNRSDYQLCPAGTTETADGFMLLEGSSTYTRAATDYCIAVARVRFEYDTGDAPDYTFSANNISIIWGPYTDAIWQRTEFKMVSGTRAMDAATGDVSYTGATFKPRVVVIIAMVNGGASGRLYSWGYATAVANQGSIGTGYAGTNLVYSYEDEGKIQSAVLKSFDADGMTLTWTRTGVTAAGTLTLQVLYLR